MPFVFYLTCPTEVVVGATGMGFGLERLINARMVAEDARLPTGSTTPQIT